MKSVFDIEDILDTLSEHFKESKEKILNAKSGELRKIAIYALKRHTGVTNKQIGERFGEISYSAVSKLYQRFLKEMEKEKRLRKKVSEIDRLLSNVKG